MVAGSPLPGSVARIRFCTRATCVATNTDLRAGAYSIELSILHSIEYAHRDVHRDQSVTDLRAGEGLELEGEGEEGEGQHDGEHGLADAATADQP